jgi:3-hydroxyisobutyrate dehydrogenase-like beta-hydroxyacid dehydrogenase
VIRPTIGFIGLGVMGHSMAGHIMEAGYPLVVNSRTRRPGVEMLVANGAVWAETPALGGAGRGHRHDGGVSGRRRAGLLQ